jgi:3-deoxy-7-phosphoheptulonate synthase
MASLGDWSLNSWKDKPASQQPDYSNSSEQLGAVVKRLKNLPPLVHVSEIKSLRSQLKAVWEGKKFILQGGDCAERFIDCSPTLIENKLKILLQMSLILVYEGKVPVLRIGRIAGQFGKPRSSPKEILADGKEVLSFRGDSINDFSPDNRDHDPERLLQAYWHSAATLNYIRALTSSGFAVRIL